MEKLDEEVTNIISDLLTEFASESDDSYARAIKNPPQRLYHYTSIDGLMGIIQGKSMFATNALFLNDYSELNYGKKLIFDALSKIKLSSDFQTKVYFGFAQKELDIVENVLHEMDTFPLDDLYISCFTTQADVLSQWRGYGSNSGVRIGFNTELLADTFENAYLADVVYNRKSQISRIEDKVSIFLDFLCNKEADYYGSKNPQSIAKAIAVLLLVSVRLFKDAAFREEKEHRLIYDPTNTEKELPVKFRNNGKFIVPYVELTTKKNKLLPITDIMVGPSSFSLKINAGIEKLLLTNGYKKVKVSISSIPFIP